MKKAKVSAEATSLKDDVHNLFDAQSFVLEDDIDVLGVLNDADSAELNSLRARISELENLLEISDAKVTDLTVELRKHVDQENVAIVQTADIRGEGNQGEMYFAQY